MKQKIYILGLIAAAILFFGTLFKIMHWPGAGWLLVSGMTFLVFAFLPAALVNHYRQEGNRQNMSLYIITWVTCLIVFSSMLFKIMHWPGAGILLIISLPFPYLVFLPVFLIVTSKNKNFNIYNTVFVLFLLAAMSSVSALLALNVSTERVADSLYLARSYNHTGHVLKTIPESARQPEIGNKIDNLLVLIEEYQDMLLSNEGITGDQWDKDPRVYLTKDMRKMKRMEKPEALDGSATVRLQSAVSELMEYVESTPGLESLAEEAPCILNLKKTENGEYLFNDRFFLHNIQPWSMIYLDGLESKLRLIKATI
jgi:hypothetical protein